MGELSADPAAGLKIATQIDVGNRPPSTMAAYYARDYRDALIPVRFSLPADTAFQQRFQVNLGCLLKGSLKLHQSAAARDGDCFRATQNIQLGEDVA